ncbi:MAG: hypothetical protein ACRCUY_12670 [Thermoguttaceae bacterium]
MNDFFNVTSPEKREKFLLGVAAILFVVIVLPMLYYLFGGDATALQMKKKGQLAEIEKLERNLEQQKTIQKRLADLAARSLPGEDSLSKSLYQNWLMDLAESAGIRERKIDPGTISSVKAPGGKGNQYTKYTFTFSGKGTLAQLTEFLQRFHKSHYLHLIRRVSPTPTRNSGELDVAMTIEALSLPQSKTSKSLPPLPENWTLSSDQEKEQLDRIISRNFFAAYSPPRPELPQTTAVEPPAENFDHAPFCYVYTVVDVEGKQQVWIDVRTEGKRYKLFEGEMFRLGGVRCFVKKIDFDRVQFEAAKNLYTIKVGNSFAEWE